MLTRFLEQLNGPWHKRAMQIFMGVVLAHWAEHLVQAYQVYALKWPMHEARGVLGQAFPWLVHSEVLHYGYALKFWHHIEHALLQGQVIAGHALFGAAQPTSIIQLFIPRLELHLVYNTLVFVPMMIGMYYHLFPSAPEAARTRCSCSLRLHSATT